MKKALNLLNYLIEMQIFQKMKKVLFQKKRLLKKKDDIDRPTLSSFDGSFQLLHADVGNLEFLGKSATDSKYCCLLTFSH